MRQAQRSQSPLNLDDILMDQIEFQKLLGNAIIQVAQEKKSRSGRAAKYSDEEMLSRILALPDKAFRLVASKVKKYDLNNMERGISWFIDVNDLERIKEDTQAIEEMGIIYWTPFPDGGAYMYFDVSIINTRLALHPEYLERLEQHALINNIRLIP